MSEGGNSQNFGDRNSSASSSAPTKPERAPRGSGRGRGRGRSRGGGRSGRGGGRGRTTDGEGSNGSAVVNNHHAEGDTRNNDNENQGGRGRFGGRGGRSGGRGRGRSGRGRSGGRGRGGRHGNKGGRSGGADNDPKSGSQNGQGGSNGVVHTNDNGDWKQDNGIEGGHNMLASVSESKASAPTPLPGAPRLVGGRGGAPMILTRGSRQPTERSSEEVDLIDHDTETQKLSESMAAAALGDFDIIEEEKKEVDHAPSTEHAGEKKAKKTTKKTKKKVNEVDIEPVPVPKEPVEDVTATDALLKLPAQEVSITETTKVQIRKSESSTSLDRTDMGPMKITGSDLTKKKGKSKKKKALSKDDAANQKAAKQFNKAVRQCVERSDPDGMRGILHDKHNHNFALDKSVLETVMKAYVMAAMFEDALYCLRNCTLPGTLTTIQTERILQCLPQNLRNSSAYTAADMINALCIATEFDSPTSRTYFLRIVRGIALEFLEEVTSARDRICSAPCERLVRSAVCVVDARLKRGKKPTELLVDAGDQLGIFVPDSMENRGIQAGDAVSLLPYAGPYPMSAESLDRNMIEATVVNTNPMVLRLQDKANSNLYGLLTENVEGNVYRIDKLANRMGFNRQLSAAVAIASPLGDPDVRDIRRPSPQLRKAITAMDENIERVMNQSGGLFKGQMTSTAALCSQAAPWNYDDESDDSADQESARAASRLALEKFGALEGLNASQRLAVEGAATNRLTLVQGPPGTGTRFRSKITVGKSHLSFLTSLCRYDQVKLLLPSEFFNTGPGWQT